MRKILLTIAAVGLCASTVHASSVGLANAERPYSISRESDVLVTRGNMPTLVNTGDQVDARDSMVQVHTSQGESIIVAPDSSVTFVDPSRLQLNGGEMAVSMAPGTHTAVLFRDLEIAPVPSTTADAEPGYPKLIVRSLSDDEIILAGFDEPFAVRQAGDGTQVAVLGNTEALRLVRDQLGAWRPLPIQLPSMQQSDLTDGTDTTDQQPGDDENRDKGGFWIFRSGTQAATVGAIGVGALALGTTGFVVYNNNQEDNNDEGGGPGGRGVESGQGPGDMDLLF